MGESHLQGCGTAFRVSVVEVNGISIYVQYSAMLLHRISKGMPTSVPYSKYFDISALSYAGKSGYEHTHTIFHLRQRAHFEMLMLVICVTEQQRNKFFLHITAYCSVVVALSRESPSRLLKTAVCARAVYRVAQVPASSLAVTCGIP